MADIELVIKIPEAYKKMIDIALLCTHEDFPSQVIDDVISAIKYGTPLPEHHGDLKDVSKLVYDCSYDNGNGCDRICHCDNCNHHVARESDIKTLPTIIPATREKSCEDCANWNEHYGTIDCMECQNRELWKPKQTATKECN